MNKVLPIVGMFAVSLFIGRQLIPTAETTVQAQPVLNSYVELPSLYNLPKIKDIPMDTINVDIDLSTLETSVNGTNNAVVRVNTTNKPEPEIKWRTKVIEKTDTVFKDFTIPFYEPELTDNSLIIERMIHLSQIITDLREARTKLSSNQLQDCDSIVKSKVKDNIASCLYMEQCLRSSVSEACKHLDGFDEMHMEPVDYISLNDIETEFVDIFFNKKVVGVIDLITGDITIIEEPE